MSGVRLNLLWFLPWDLPTEVALLGTAWTAEVVGWLDEVLGRVDEVLVRIAAGVDDDEALEALGAGAGAGAATDPAPGK